jgi:excisionase family DNA binding protein
MSEQLLTVAEVAEMLDVSKDTVRRMFAAEVGVINLRRKQDHGDRRYRILRIPRKVLDRVISERSVGREVAADPVTTPTKPP